MSHISNFVVHTELAFISKLSICYEMLLNEIIPYILFVSLIYLPKNKNKIKRYKIPCMVREILTAYFRKIKICH